VTDIKHEGKFFGLIKNNLNIKKKGCLVEVTFKNILETTWKVDVCREPVHIKVKKMENESFYKRKGTCLHGLKDDFCEHWKGLKENLQDYGLIFAKGERETISTSHGQTYCTYLLLQRYLDDGVLFSKFESPKSIFKKEEVVEASSLSISAPVERGATPIMINEEKSEMTEPEVLIEDKADEKIIDEDKPRF
jgi:hypothetical protein